MEERVSGLPSATKHERKIGLALFRYILVGLFSNACGYGLYLTVTWLGVRPMIAMSFLYSAGAALGFFGNYRWAFVNDRKAWSSLIRYWMAHSIGYGLNFLMLYFFAGRLGYPHQLVQAAAVFIVAGFLFLMFNYFVFPQVKAAHTS